MAETQDTGKRQFAVRSALRTVCRHYVLFGLMASLFAIVALFVTPYAWEKKYTGTAKLRRRQEPTLNAQASSFEGFKQVLTHELAGRDAVRHVIEDLHLVRGLPRGSDGVLTPKGRQSLQEMVERFRRQLRIDWDVKTEEVDQVSVSFTHQNAKLAQEVPNTLVDNYLNRVSDAIVQRLKDSCDFLSERVSDAETRLEEVTRERIGFEKENAEALPENPGALEERSRQLSRDIDTVRLQHKIAKQKLERLKAMADKVEADPDEPVQVIKGPNPELARLREELETREEELQAYEDTLQDYRIVGRMTDEHPKVEALKAKIASAEEKVAEVGKQIEETEEEVVTQRVFSTERDREQLTIAVAAAESEYEMAENELQRLERRLKDYDKYLAQYAPIREKWLLITKQQRDLEEEKRSWEQRLRDVEMALTAEVAKRRNRLDQVQFAEEQQKPSSPKLLHLLGVALVGGLAFGSAIVFLTSLKDRTIWTPQDAEDLFGVPVCGTIGEIVPPRTRFWRCVQRYAIEPGVAVLLLAAIGVGSLNVILWLQYPDQYVQWTAAPLAYLGDRASFVWAGISWRI